jgi:soluble lytic murein transglycosylase-like protein
MNMLRLAAAWMAALSLAGASHADRFYLSEERVLEGILVRDDAGTVTFEMDGAGTWTLSKQSLLRVENESAGDYWMRAGERHAKRSQIDRARRAFQKAAEDPHTADSAARRLKDLDQLESGSALTLAYPIRKIESSPAALASNQPLPDIPSELDPEPVKTSPQVSPKSSQLPEFVPASTESRLAKTLIDEPRGSEEEISRLIRKYARQYGVDPLLVRAIITVESEWDPRATSSSGARGLMQLMPDTAAHMGVRNPYDPEQNIQGGIKYLSQMFEEFRSLEWDERKVQAIAAYHAGPNKIKEVGNYRQIPATLRYTEKVAAAYDRLRRQKNQEVAFLARISPNLD